MRRWLPTHRADVAIGSLVNSFDRMRDELDQWFDDVSKNIPGIETIERMRFGVPYVEVTQNESDVMVTAELPGVESNDLDVRVFSREVSIKAEKKRAEDSQSDNVYRSERYYGVMSRTVALPVEVDPEKASATFKNGILEIRAAKVLPNEPGKKLNID